ncbi:hypothetical protein NEAUS03_2416, partial [Nematocida ausubeli]
LREEENKVKECIAKTAPEMIRDMESGGKIEFAIEDEECEIKTIGDTKIIQKGMIMHKGSAERVNQKIKQLEDAGIIRESTSEWRNPVRALDEDRGGGRKVRIVCNMMKLNDLVEKDQYKLPEIKQIYERMENSRIYSVIDLKDGYHQIKIKEEDRHKTAFEVPTTRKVYEWCGMVMGYKNAPMIFQRIMDRTMRGLLGNGVEVFVDDIIIHSKTYKEHRELVEKVIERLRKKKMRVNLKKMQLFRTEAKILGHTVSNATIKVTRETIEKAMNYIKPETYKEMQRFLGFMGYYRNFIEKYAIIEAPLRETLIGKPKMRARLEWTESMEKAYSELREKLKDSGSILLGDRNRGVKLRVDASDVGVGAVLLGLNDEKQWQPIRWASKRFGKGESSWGITEKEMFGVYFGVKKFEYELRGRTFTIETDHKALLEIRKKETFNNKRVQRWAEEIQEYDFEVVYIKGEENVDADVLSRMHREREEEIANREEARIDESKLIEENNKLYFICRDGVKREVPDWNERRGLIERVHVEKLHAAPEVVKKHILEEGKYWKGMIDDITRIRKECEECEKCNRKHKGGAEFVETKSKLEKVGIDIMKEERADKLILVMIDYYTRTLMMRIIEKKTTQEVKRVIEEWIEKKGKPKEIVSDNAAELVGDEMWKYLVDKDIKHRTVAVEAHSSNGRVERV